MQYIDAKSLPEGLDSALAEMQTDGALRPQRGMLIAVTAPLPGCGRTTVALNLAGALARNHPGEAALIEVAREGSPAADWLGIEVDHPAHDVFGRHHHLDASSLKGSFARHASGIHLLLNSPELGRNPALDSAAVKRLAVLTRVASRFTVFSVDAAESETGWAALRAADVVLLVVRGDVPSIKRARRLLENLGQQDATSQKVRIVLNRDGQAGQLSLNQIESGLGRSVDFRIAEDAARVNRAMNYGQLVVETWRSPIARGFRKLAASLAGEPEPSSWWPFRS